MENRRKVYISSSEHEAIIICDRLKSEGIDAIVLDLKDHVSEVVGTYEIHVADADEERARKIIADSE